jgi:hypothetical protein
MIFDDYFRTDDLKILLFEICGGIGLTFLLAVFLLELFPETRKCDKCREPSQTSYCGKCGNALPKSKYFERLMFAVKVLFRR